MFIILIVASTILFFQAEDGIRDLVRSRGLGDVYKRQTQKPSDTLTLANLRDAFTNSSVVWVMLRTTLLALSLIHI